jgi:hypothetical protein
MSKANGSKQTVRLVADAQVALAARRIAATETPVEHIAAMHSFMIVPGTARGKWHSAVAVKRDGRKVAWEFTPPNPWVTRFSI